VSLVAAAGCLDEPALETQAQEVQAANVGVHFDLVQDDSVASHATGMIEVPIRDTNGTPQTVPSNLGVPYPPTYQVRGTCGVTFISPHYAITATHCVDSTLVPNPANTGLWVRAYDITDVVETWHLLFPGNVTGDYPNYTPITGYGQGADQVPGYQWLATNCTVRARCAFNGSPAFNCTTGGDVALLYCPNRASNAAWLPVAPSDPQTGPVDMYWFHEVLYMPTAAPAPGSPASAFDRFTHYTQIQEQLTLRKNNFHYLNARTNVILPLKSRPWPNGAARTRVGQGNNTWTDLYGCHGTSGSGVLQVNAAGKHELLGPVSGATEAWGRTDLCTKLSSFNPGVPNISYTPNSSVRALETAFLTELTADRPPPPPPPPPPAICGGVRASEFSCICGDQACVNDAWTCINCNGGGGESG
jgi:hypothetical protein